HRVLHAAGKESHEKISYAASRDATFKVLQRQNVRCVHVTHSGRHSGTVEGQRLGIPDDDIRIAGRWVTGTSKFQQYYNTNYPVDFAKGFAGFLNKPFHLKCNEVIPSLDLERKVFPFIKLSLYEEGSLERQKWVERCDKAMRAMHPNDQNNLKTIETYKDMEAQTRMAAS
ncbi:hypothetical protein BGZ76_008012, partial [Entomortierella beljakovae]